MLTELNQEQTRIMHETREDWLAKLFDKEKKLVITQEKAEKAVHWLYAISKLQQIKLLI